MGATSVTGQGPGSSGKFTTTQLAILANGPSILLAQYAEAIALPISPEAYGNEVLFPVPFPGASTNYIVHITTINGGAAWVTSMDEADGDFIGFNFVIDALAESTVMYHVINVGIKPEVEPE